MVSGWAASGMLWAASGFNKIRHSIDQGGLATALSASVTSPSLRSAKCTPVDHAELIACITSIK